MLRKRFSVFIVCFFSIFCLLSCGLEAFYYVDYIPQGEMFDVTRAIVHLPPADAEGYSTSFFSNFIIFYRIYISGELRSGVVQTPTDRSSINTTLNSDFTSFYSYTDITSTTVSTSNLENLFYSRRYHKLELEAPGDIDNVLGSGALNKILEIEFPERGERPTLSLRSPSDTTSNEVYTLWRATERSGYPIFNPMPADRYFLNSPDLYNSANVTDLINADVATNSSSGSGPRYTYVSMYIAAAGRSGEMPPRAIYSQPTFIGVFKLAD